MMTFIPILPLKSVVYPTETLNLHLSYKNDVQLIEDTIVGKGNLGIVFRNGKEFLDYGTQAEVTELAEKFENGEINVRLKGMKVFRILDIKDDIPEKKYSGAIVDYPLHEEVKVAPEMEQRIVSEVKRLYELMQVENKFPPKTDDLISYDFAHKIGLNSKQEYELLTIFSEIQRMEYIRRHLNAMAPVVVELENMKKRIQMNGHFRNLS